MTTDDIDRPRYGRFHDEYLLRWARITLAVHAYALLWGILWIWLDSGRPTIWRIIASAPAAVALVVVTLALREGTYRLRYERNRRPYV